MFDLKKHSVNICLEGNGHTYTYADVQQAAYQMSISIDSRSLILCFSENSIPSLIGYITCMEYRHVPILIDGSQKSNVIQDIISQYSPEYVWISEERSGEIQGYRQVHRLDTYVLMKAQAAGSRVASVAMDDQLQLLLSTSGSTGASKFVRISRNNLRANAASIIQYLGICAQDVAITTLPYSYSFGLSIINTHLFAGATIQVTNFNLISREFWELADRKKITSLSGVPYTFDILERIKFERFSIKSLRYIAQAGGKLSQTGLDYLLRISKEKNLPCFAMYGQTEATARMSYLPADLLSEKLGSIGIAIQNGKFELIDKLNTTIEAPFIKGELIYYGPNVSMGYASSRIDLALGDELNGLLRTGDLAYRDAEGFYYITGRLKRFVKLFGNRVSLDEVEALLHANFPDDKFICSGQDDCMKIGCVGKINIPEVLTLLSQRLTINKSAFQCIELDEIPRLSNGKINFNAFST